MLGIRVGERRRGGTRVGVEGDQRIGERGALQGKKSKVGRGGTRFSDDVSKETFEGRRKHIQLPLCPPRPAHLVHRLRCRPSAPLVLYRDEGRRTAQLTLAAFCDDARSEDHLYPVIARVEARQGRTWLGRERREDVEWEGSRGNNERRAGRGKRGGRMSVLVYSQLREFD